MIVESILIYHLKYFCNYDFLDTGKSNCRKGCEVVLHWYFNNILRNFQSPYNSTLFKDFCMKSKIIKWNILKKKGKSNKLISYKSFVMYEFILLNVKNIFIANLSIFSLVSICLFHRGYIFIFRECILSEILIPIQMKTNCATFVSISHDC